MSDKGKGKAPAEVPDTKGKDKLTGNASASGPSSGSGSADALPPDLSFDDEEGGFFSVQPKLDCPHIRSEAGVAPLGPNVVISVQDPCSVCGASPENWICLRCHQVFCSRYVHGHGQIHHNETGHAIATSFSDLSTWCYVCSEYVENRTGLRPFKTALYLSKFGTMPPDAIAGSGGLEFVETD
ncbi:hypothetical protein DFJ74DRAFT_675185, partial [Hyaloraphidium curvatum]